MSRVTQNQRELHLHDQQDFLSASTHADDASASPYRRDGHWGADLSDGDVAGAKLAQLERAKTPKDLWIAKTVLRREARWPRPHRLEERARER